MDGAITYLEMAFWIMNHATETDVAEYNQYVQEDQRVEWPLFVVREGATA
jgi:hypothetical protein